MNKENVYHKTILKYSTHELALSQLIEDNYFPEHMS